jgi:hypothetical protein
MINSIVTELKTIAEAFESVEGFIYNRPSAVNWNDRTMGYPRILVDSQVDVDIEGVNTKNLFKQKSYKFRFFAFDEYKIADQNETTQELKQQTLETIIDQYIGEVRRRTLLDSTKGFRVGAVTGGFHAFPVHNDKVMQVSFGVELISGSLCGTGNFSYDE